MEAIRQDWLSSELDPKDSGEWIGYLIPCNIIPFLTFLYAVHSSFQSRRDPVEILEQLQTAILSETLIFMGVGIWLVYLVSSNMTRPLQEIVRVLRGVRNGQFGNKVRVTSNERSVTQGM